MMQNLTNFETDLSMERLSLYVIYLWIVTFMSIPMNLTVAKALNKMKALPESVLVQLKEITIISLLHSVVNWAVYVIPLTYYSIFGFRASLSVMQCSIWAFPANVLAGGVTVSYSVLAMERWNRTRNEYQATHESKIKPIIVGTAIGWLILTISTVNLARGQIITPEQEFIFYCGSLTRYLRSDIFFIVAMSFIGTECILSVFYILIFIKNQRNLAQFSLITSKYSIVQRYQMRQTLRSFKMVAPSIGAHILMNIIMMSCIFATLQNLDPNDALNTDVGIGLVMPLFQPIFFVLHPIAVVAFDKDMQTHIKSIFKKETLPQVTQMATIRTVAYHMTPNNNAMLVANMWAKHRKLEKC